MAKLMVCSVYDRALEGFSRPFFVPAIGMAVRSFSDEVNRVAPDNEMNRHPEDYSLFQLASFDDSTGEFETAVRPLQLCTALQEFKGEK